MIHDTEQYRAMPSSLEAERIILGAILLDNYLIAETVERLAASDFYHPFHRKVFAAMFELYLKSEQIISAAICEEIKRTGTYPETFGKEQAMMNLYHGMPRFDTLDKEISIVIEKSNKRELARQLSATISELLEDEEEFSASLNKAEGVVFNFSKGETTKNFETVYSIASEEIEFARECVRTETMLEPVKTGFDDLDDLLGTLEPELIIIGALPSIGKTSFTLNLAEEFALTQGKTVVLFSLEMSKKALTNRLVCSRAEVDHKRFKLKAITQPELKRIEAVELELANSDFYINDQSDISPVQVLSKCRKLRTEKKRLDLVVIDYLQMMTPSHYIRDLRERVTEVSKELAQVKKELQVPMLVVASLSRASETGQVRKPRASDLRESGQIESDADQIWLLHREGHYNPQCASPSLADLNVVKNRNGETGGIQLFFQKEYTKFKNSARY